MESNVLGQKTSNPAAKLTSLMNKREKLQHELRNIEKQVYELETTYLQETNHFADILKGYDGFLSSSKSTTRLKNMGVIVSIYQNMWAFYVIFFQFSIDQLFLVVVGSPDYGPGRSKGDGLPANGQGKPKKGRLGPRDGKRIRLSSEAGLEDEDDTQA